MERIETLEEAVMAVLTESNCTPKCCGEEMKLDDEKKNWVCSKCKNKKAVENKECGLYGTKENGGSVVL